MEAVAIVRRRLDPSQLPAQPSTVSGHVMEEGKEVDGFRRYLKYKTVNEDLLMCQASCQ